MKKILFSVLAAILCMGFVSAQTDIYVSAEKGNDTYDGTSWATPYQTIDAALDQLNGQPGIYNIYLAQGEYELQDNDGAGGNDNDEYELAAGQNVNIYGGYPTPYDTTPPYDPPASPEIFTSALYSQNTSNASSAFRIVTDSDAKLTFQDVSIIDIPQGGEGNGAFLTFDDAENAGLTFENVHVSAWIGEDAGFIYVYGSQGVDIAINNSLIERSSNAQGSDGQLIRTYTSSVRRGEDIDILMTETVIRNIRGVGADAAIFFLEYNCTYDNGQSELILRDNEFYNIKRGLASGQAASLIVANELPKLILERNIFQGITGGDGGVLQYDNGGYFYSKDNLYQDNHGGQAGGAVYISGSYPCQENLADPYTVEFINDKFIDNQSGIDNLAGYGGAIHIANNTAGSGQVDKPISITNCIFKGNNTSGYDGGAVYANLDQDVLLNIQNSTFCNNEANTQAPQQAGNGGAVFVRGDGNLTISGSTFRENVAGANNGGNGGALYTGVTGDVLINGCTYFYKNQTTANGGALHGEEYRSFVIDGATFEENRTIADATLNTSFDAGAVNLDASTNVTSNPEIKNVTFTNNISALRGGAIWTSAELYIDNVIFTGNESAQRGGALYGNPSASLYVTNSDFTSNTTGTDGGAIYSDNFVQLTNTTFTSNTATNGDGGAIAHVENIDLTFNQVDFINNIAADQGGALYLVTTNPSSANADLNLTQAYFQGNQANGENQGAEGGAIYLNGFGINTSDGTTDVGNVVFKDNTVAANGKGGAIYIFKIGTQDILLNNGIYYGNDGGEYGGAIYMKAVSTLADHFVNYNHFVGNKATLAGGAIAVDDQNTREIDQLIGNRFYNNEWNGLTDNYNYTERSDIWLEYGTNFDARIVTMNDNFLQFPAEEDPYYPTNNTSTANGYNLGTGNQQQLTDPTVAVSTFATTTPVTACILGDCPEKVDTPASPIVLSTANTATETNVNSGEEEDYGAFTKVGIDPNATGECGFYDAEVAFTMRSNRASDLALGANGIIPNPTPEIEITYAITVVNNFTGESVNSLETITAINATRVEDPSDEIPDGQNGDLVRDIYKTYYLDVTNDIQPGYTYSYSIVGANVPVLISTNPDVYETQTYTYEVGKYKTDIIADFCACTIGAFPGTTDIKDTYVGISTLDRNVDEWLVDGNEEGAYVILESTTKGLVVPRFDDQTAIDENVGSDMSEGVEDGMIVWDNAANCLKLFYNDTWNCISDDNCNNTTP